MRQLTITPSITTREEISLDKYFIDISKEGLISLEEEVELANRIKQGDNDALDRLARANLRFVVSVAKQYNNKGLSLPDLINEGNIGLMVAAKRFDPTRGFKFISYAVWWIRQSIIQAIAEQSRLIRMPLNQVGTLNKMYKAVSKFEQENGRIPSNEELAEYIDMPFEKIINIVELIKKPLSVDASLSYEEDGKLADFIENKEIPSTDNELLKQSLKQEIDTALKMLSERESTIIKLSFGIETRALSLDEISEKLGLSRERIRQIKVKAIKRLRNSSKIEFLKTYLG